MALNYVYLITRRSLLKVDCLSLISLVLCFLVPTISNRSNKGIMTLSPALLGSCAPVSLTQKTHLILSYENLF